MHFNLNNSLLIAQLNPTVFVLPLWKITTWIKLHKHYTCNAGWRSDPWIMSYYGWLNQSHPGALMRFNIWRMTSVESVYSACYLALKRAKTCFDTWQIRWQYCLLLDSSGMINEVQGLYIHVSNGNLLRNPGISLITLKVNLFFFIIRNKLHWCGWSDTIGGVTLEICSSSGIFKLLLFGKKKIKNTKAKGYFLYFQKSLTNPILLKNSNLIYEP